ncbi:Proclotting enzyme [Amphibalanus amphitrite]|uniref:Proclotting enzyme n=1 Tax=Amphibalanus amphitrite TaxID=1232801 RepID=A0A6A4VBN6_AMPAM|nr:Proclotting enzyme [Amphibalanus amphitrite]
MAPRSSLTVLTRTAAVLCCLSVVTAINHVTQQGGNQDPNQGVYRRCADGRSVAVPCLQPTTDCTDRSVPSRIPGSCVRWYSCCKEPPRDVDYVRSPEEKAARRGEMYQKAVGWLVAGARAIKTMWNSFLDKVRGEKASGAQHPPYGHHIPPGAEPHAWRGPVYDEQHQGYGNHRNPGSQQPNGVYGYANSKSYQSSPIKNWVTDYKSSTSGYGSPTKPSRGGYGRPSWPPNSFTSTSSTKFPSGSGFSSRLPTKPSHFSTRVPTVPGDLTPPSHFMPSSPTTSDKMTPSRFPTRVPTIPGDLVPPSTDSASERTTATTRRPLTGADAIVAEAARRWLPSDCGRLSPLSSFSGLGRRRRRRDITGGHPADRSRWAWMAVIGMRQPGENWAENRGQGPVWICGGAVVTPRFVLTAAHCVGGRALDKLVVRLGEYNLSSTTDGPHQDRLVSAVTLHPQFVSRQNDVALLRLDVPAEFGLLVRPVCLPVPGAPVPPPGLRRVAGWGRLSFEGAGAAVLQEAKLTLVPADACESIYRRLSSFGESFPGGGFLGTKLCAVDPSTRGADACLGDSGGPLTGLRPDGRFALVGIVSLGVGCGDPDFPGVYTRVESYVPWIVAVIATAEAEAAAAAKTV